MAKKLKLLKRYKSTQIRYENNFFCIQFFTISFKIKSMEILNLDTLFT